MNDGLQGEIRRTKPFDVLEEEVHLGIVRTAALLEHAFGQTLKPYGITSTQYNVLRILRGAGASGLCRNEIGERLIRPVPDVTRLLDRMEQMGLIDRQRETADRRMVRTHVTAKGLAMLDELDGPILTMHRQRLAHVDRAALRTLADTLTEIRHAATH